MGRAGGVEVGSPIDCLAAREGADGCDQLIAGFTTFTGRYWTGGLRTLSRAKGGLVVTGRTDLRAGVAAVNWLSVQSDGGPVAVSGSDDGSVDLWQAVGAEADASAPTLRHLEGAMAHSHLVSGVSANEQGTQFASCSWDHGVRVWNTAVFLECTASLAGHQDLVHSVAWTGADTLLSASQDRSIRQWDARAGACTAALSLQHPVLTASQDPAGCLVAAGDECGGLAFFDMRRPGVQLALLQGLHRDAVRALAWPQASGSHALVASAGDDGRVCIVPQGHPISAERQQVRTPHKPGAYIRGLACTRHGLYSGAWDGVVVASDL